MNAKLKKLLCVALSALLLVPALAACSTGDDPDDSKAETTGKTEVSTDPVDQALNELKGKIDWKGEEFGILYNSGIGGSKEEMEAQAQFAGESSNAVINDAVFERNTLFQEYCNLKLVHLAVSAESYNNTLINGIQTGTRDFYLSSTSTGDTASSALQGYLYDYMKLDIDYNQIWWDAGTLNFALDGRVFFMNGPFNIVDDDVTYFFAFNKKLAQEHQLPNLYQKVRDLNWTMDYMNTVISNLSTDNGDGTWDDKDTYGLTATDVIAASFFYGAGLKYVENNRDMDTPQLMLDEKMDRALSVLDMARSIIHDNNSTYRGIGMSIFMQDRALFGYEVISYLRGLSSSMESGYGVLPVPMFDQGQGRYYAHSNPIGTTLSIPTSAAQVDMTRFGQTLEMYAVLSQKLIRPAYYEVTLMTRNVQDLDSTEMLEIILSSRVYDMAAYFADLGLSGVFEEAVTGTSDNFSSTYASASRAFDKKVKNMLKKLQKMDK
jgi:hypothetical protein